MIQRNLYFFFRLIFSLLALWPDEVTAQENAGLLMAQGAIVRGDQAKKQLALVFTGHQYAEGGDFILESLEESQTKASFFFTGDFYRNTAFEELIDRIQQKGHYLGAHSDKHLLYCDWRKRDSLLVSKEEFVVDLVNNYAEMQKIGVMKQNAQFYLPPYEWYNDSISKWASELGLRLINFTPGTRSNTDYTSPEMANYVSSDVILKSILEKETADGLNGFMLLMHIGAGPARKDKFYKKLPEMVKELKSRGYELVTIEKLLDSPNKP